MRKTSWRKRHQRRIKGFGPPEMATRGGARVTRDSVEKEQLQGDQSEVRGAVAWRSGRVSQRLRVEGGLNYIEP